MNRFLFTVIAVVLACIATLVPVGLGVYMAQLDANRREHEQLLAFADAALIRTEMVERQATDVLREMERLPQKHCSSAYLEQVRRIFFARRFVQDAGIYSDGTILCSALLPTPESNRFRLPPPDWRSNEGVEWWFDLDNPFGAKRKSILIGHNGSFVSIDPQSYIDTFDGTYRVLAAVNTAASKIFAVTPGADRAQMETAWRHNGQMTDDDWVFAVRKSAVLPLAIVVKTARSHLLENWKMLLAGWLLVGLVTGLMLGGLVVRLLSRSFSLQGQLQKAVRRREFEVHYQPIIALVSARCVGAEALVRWRHDGQLVRPDLFIQLAESTGLIQQVTDQVLDIVVAELGDYLRRTADFYISINVSAEDLKTRRFLKVLEAKLAGTGIAPEQIRIEATERGFMDADTARSTIQAFRDAGHPVYIDDFGTGYSSLSYLQNFKVDMLKIDKSFVDTVGQEAASSSVAPHIITMAHALGIEVIAEGVEDEAQARYLREHGAQYGQGWLFAKAMPVSEFIRFLGK